MLIIRNEQMDALRQHSLRTFEKRLITHFREHFQDQCAALDEKDLREIVRQGMERAASFGFTSERGPFCTVLPGASPFL